MTLLKVHPRQGRWILGVERMTAAGWGSAQICGFDGTTGTTCGKRKRLWQVDAGKWYGKTDGKQHTAEISFTIGELLCCA